MSSRQQTSQVGSGAGARGHVRRWPGAPWGTNSGSEGPPVALPPSEDPRSGYSVGADAPDAALTTGRRSCRRRLGPIHPATAENTSLPDWPR